MFSNTRKQIYTLREENRELRENNKKNKLICADLRDENEELYMRITKYQKTQIQIKELLERK